MFKPLPIPSWLSATRARLAERARLREDAETVSRMDARELRDLGLSHLAAARGEVMREPLLAQREVSWIHAEPRFLRRSTPNASACLGHGHLL